MQPLNQSPRAQRAHQLAVRARELLRADWMRNDPVAHELRKAANCFKRAGALARAHPESDAAFRFPADSPTSSAEIMREMQSAVEHLLERANPPISLDDNASTCVTFHQHDLTEELT